MRVVVVVGSGTELVTAPLLGALLEELDRRRHEVVAFTSVGRKSSADRRGASGGRRNLRPDGPRSPAGGRAPGRWAPRRKSPLRWTRRIPLRAGSRRRARTGRAVVADLLADRAIPEINPTSGSINDSSHVREMERLSPDVAFSIYCLQIWRQPLLKAMPYSVNYHNGLLPHYAGLGATSFSLYHGEPESGFTFHLMTAGVDAGPILVQGSVPVRPKEGLATVAVRKQQASMAAVPQLIDHVEARDPGRPQQGSGSYFSDGDWRALVEVEDPAAELTVDELKRRLRAFAQVRVPLWGELAPVTAISKRRRPLRPVLELRDGRRYVERIDRLPAPRYLMRRRLTPTRLASARGSRES